MAGFFGLFNYSKPGPGIPKDAPPKPRIKVFFEILYRKFWNLIKINILFFVFNIPAVFAALILGTYLSPRVLNDDMADFVIMVAFIAVFLCIPIITFGPAQAGFTYLLRNYAREEHAFIWWDFKENALKNLKESIIISLIDIAVVVILIIDLKASFTYAKSNNFMLVANVFVIIAFAIYFIMHMYIYPILVTFKLNVRQILKNSLIFALLRFFPGLGIILICIAFILLPFLYSPVIGAILFPVITMSLVGLITNFFAFPTIKKFMIDKVEDSEVKDENKEVDIGNAKG